MTIRIEVTVTGTDDPGDNQQVVVHMDASPVEPVTTVERSFTILLRAALSALIKQLTNDAKLRAVGRKHAH